MDINLQAALMYDFYNEHLLKGQNDDIKYYQQCINKYKPTKTLIVGAGTGRVAIPLSKITVLDALDMDSGRIALLKLKDNKVNTIISNFLSFNTNEKYDVIIFPYSTIQFYSQENPFKAFLKKANSLLNKNGVIIFDVSEGFNTKPNAKKELLFTDYCERLKQQVEVYYSAKRHANYVEFLVDYKLCNDGDIIVEHEKYSYYDEQKLKILILELGFKLITIDDGYNGNDFKHKHIFHCRRGEASE